MPDQKTLEYGRPRKWPWFLSAKLRLIYFAVLFLAFFGGVFYLLTSLMNFDFARMRRVLFHGH